MRLPIVVSCCAAIALVLPSQAANPKITLSLTGATAEEAVARLAKAADVPVQLHNPDGSPAARQQQDAVLMQRQDFDWKNVTFAAALRDLTKRYSLRPGKRSNGYVLYFTFGAPQAVGGPKPVGLVEKGSIRLSARSVSVIENRGINFQDGANNGVGNLHVQVGANLGDLDADDVAGVQNVIVKDDLGNVVGQKGNTLFGGYQDGAFPDEWTGSISLPAPHPKAKKLVWLEADLLTYRANRTFRLEVPLPLVERVVKVKQGDVSVSVSNLVIQPQQEEEDVEPLLRRAAAQAAPADTLTLRTRLYYPAQARPKSQWGYSPMPYLVGKSGRTYAGVQVRLDSGGDGQTQVQQMSLTFPNVGEAPAKLVWDLVERSDPQKLLTFRMTDIPLPAALEFDARAAAPERPMADTQAEERPFFQKGGGILISPVDVLGKPAGSGSLDLGLAPKTPDGWGAVRWIQRVDVIDGLARLESVSPGRYRLLRRFKPRDGDAVAGAGRWVNEQVEVILSAGKESRAVPLQWSKTPASPRSGAPPGGAAVPKARTLPPR